jgi:hypothetical protein
MALTGAIGTFIGASLTKNVPINFFLIGSIISYESFTLLKDNINTKRDNKINNKNNKDKEKTENRLNLNQKSIKQKILIMIFCSINNWLF